MTVYDQAALFITITFVVVIGALWAIDQVCEQIDRNRTWRAIEVRSAMERHPSSRVDVFDQDAES